MKDKETHRSKGFAFVLFLDRDSAQKCIRALNGVQVWVSCLNENAMLHLSAEVRFQRESCRLNKQTLVADVWPKVELQHCEGQWQSSRIYQTKGVQGQI